MKNVAFFLVFSLIGFVAYAQNKDEAGKIIDEGVSLHDKGNYGEALRKYDKALSIDKDNLRALAEKAYTYLTIKKYEESIACCKKAIAAHPGDSDLEAVYITYGTCYDEMEEPLHSLDIYNQGIAMFPNAYLLHFNKGITLVGQKKYDDAVVCFEKSAMLNPWHAGSHNALGNIMLARQKNIPALLALSRFFVLEQESKRAENNLASIKEIMSGGGNVKKTGKQSITISVNSDLLKDSTADGKRIENSFSTTELILQMTAALDNDKENRKKSDEERFAKKFSMICSSLKETKKDNYGFFWEYYAPYFIEMNDKGFVNTFAYIVFAGTNDRAEKKWLKDHPDEIKSFYNWSKDFEWKKN